MYMAQKETTDEIKGMLSRLISQSTNIPPSNEMVTSDTISTHKRKDVDLLMEMIDDYLENHPEENGEEMMVDYDNASYPKTTDLKNVGAKITRALLMPHQSYRIHPVLATTMTGLNQICQIK
jgi:hypothetical protein